MSCCGIIQVGGNVPGGGGGSPAALPVEQGVIQQGVNATGTAFHGTTDDQVIRFNGPTQQVGAIAVATWVTIADSATLGTTFTILQPGEYWIDLYLPAASGSTAQLGITLDAPASVRQNSFDPTMPSVLDNRFTFSGWPLGSLNARALCIITQAMIDAGRNVIRAQLGDIANGPVNTGVFAVPADVTVRIDRVGEAA